MDWTDAKRARLRAGREAGKSYNAIAKELGCTKSAAIGMGQRLGLPSANPTGVRLPNTNIRYKPWDEETTARFIAAWTTRDDINRATIARMFGVSEETAKNRSVALGITRCVHQSQQPGPRREAAAAMRAKIMRHAAPLPKLRLVPPAPKPVIAPPMPRNSVPMVCRASATACVLLADVGEQGGSYACVLRRAGCGDLLRGMGKPGRWAATPLGVGKGGSAHD